MRPQESDQILDIAQVDKMDLLDESCFEGLFVSELRIILDLIFSDHNAATSQIIGELFIQTANNFVGAPQHVDLEKFVVLLGADECLHGRGVYIIIYK